MGSMSAANLDYNLFKVNSEITQSVKSLKAKSAGSFSPAAGNSSENAGKAYQPGFIYNFAVSYLEPSASFNIHEILSEKQPDLQKEREKGRQVMDNADEAAAGRQSNEVSAASFADLLGVNTIQYSPAEVARLYQPLMPAENLFTYTGEQVGTENSRKAAAAYDYVFNINKVPDVLIDFMHPANRSFNYTI